MLKAKQKYVDINFSHVQCFRYWKEKKTTFHCITFDFGKYNTHTSMCADIFGSPVKLLYFLSIYLVVSSLVIFTLLFSYFFFYFASMWRKKMCVRLCIWLHINLLVHTNTTEHQFAVNGVLRDRILHTKKHNNNIQMREHTCWTRSQQKFLFVAFFFCCLLLTFYQYRNQWFIIRHRFIAQNELSFEIYSSKFITENRMTKIEQFLLM